MSATDMHTKAMSLYDTALSARRGGDMTGFQSAVAAALAEEASAAQLFAAEHGLEPTRSILFRSAATIAMAGREFARAIELAAAGLAFEGVPPLLRAELVGLLKDANYRLNVLETEGVSIGDESLVLSLEGEAVGNGMVRHEVFKAKLGAVVNIINRTLDRIQGVAFGDARARPFTAPLYVSPPIPGSFAIEVKMGNQLQPDLTGVPSAVDVDAVLEEVVESFQEFKEGDLEALRRRIPGDEYYTNFVALSRTLQPDGAKITSVELVGNLHKGVKRVRMTTPKTRAPRRLTIGVGEDQKVEISGILRVAEKKQEGREKVEVIDDNGKWHEIHVPASLMSDVVRPLWDCRVTILAKRLPNRKYLELEEIEAAT